MTAHGDYLQIPCLEGPGLKLKVTEMVYFEQSDYQRIAIYDTENYGRCLFLDDVIQCSEIDHEVYDSAILSKLSPSDRSLLVLGGGDGHTAQMALRLNPGIRVTVVELDQAVVKAAETHLGQDIFRHTSVTTIINDAIDFMTQTSARRYDCIVCDLTDIPLGHNGGACRDFYSEVFPRANRVLSNSGWIATYAGCDTKIAEDIARTRTHDFEKSTVYVPSFGEPCFIVYGRNTQQIPQKEAGHETSIIGFRRTASLHR